MKQDFETVNLSLVKELIENRKMAKLKKLFPEDESRNIDLMFYFYKEDGRYMKKLKSEQKIIFSDNEYIAVKSIRGYNSRHDNYYHSLWIIGIDDVSLYIHRLAWNRDFEDENYTIDNEEIKRLMGFNESVENIQVIEKDKPIRLQGDLIITKTEELEDHISKEIANKTALWSYKYEYLLDKKISKEKEFLELDNEIDKDLDRYYKNYDKEVLKELCKKYDYSGGWSSFTVYLLQYVKGDTLRKYREKRYKEIGKENIQKYVKDVLNNDKKIVEKAIREIETKQINFAVGNHLIIFTKAKGNISNWDNEIIVKDKSSMFVIHDQHQSKSILLDKGIYTIRLLNRHRNG